MTRIAFIGLGNMGRPMSRHLVAAGHAVAGYDLSERARAAFAADGGMAAGSPAEAMAWRKPCSRQLAAGVVKLPPRNAILVCPSSIRCRVAVALPRTSSGMKAGMGWSVGCAGKQWASADGTVWNPCGTAIEFSPERT